MTLVNNRRKVAARRPIPGTPAQPQFRTYSSFAAKTPVLIREAAGGKIIGRGVVQLDPKLGAIVRNAQDTSEYVYLQGNKVFQKQPNGSMRLVGEISMAPAAPVGIRRRADEAEVADKGMVPYEQVQDGEDEVADEAATDEPSMEDAGVDGDPENKATATAAMHEKMVAAYQLADIKAKLGKIPGDQVVKEAMILEKTKSLKEIKAQIEALNDVAPSRPMVPRRAASIGPVPQLPKVASAAGADDGLVLASIGHDRDLQALHLDR